MAPLTSYEIARFKGLKAAQEQHRHLGTILQDRVAIFDVIEDARIWLFFRPLRNLYGAYERQGDAAGIIINSQHPLNLQRFTAAHEYGHHVLGHLVSADDEDHIYRDGNQQLQEVAAQAFAGEFMMPIQLVNYSLSAIGVTGQHSGLVPEQIYQLALQLGVSYSAALTQLAAQKKLSNEMAHRYRGMSPLEIKTIVGGKKPEHSWANVWLFDGSQGGRHIVPQEHDEIHVTLQETPSTGYIWELVDSAPHVLELISDAFEEDVDDGRVGRSGLRHFWFRVRSPGTGRIRLEMRRPWQTEGQMALEFEITLAALKFRTGDLREGITVDQRKSIIDDYRTIGV